MKKIIQIWLLCFVSTITFSQTNNTKKYADSLQMLVMQTTNDTLKMTALSDKLNYKK